MADVEHGEIFTRRWIVELMLDMADYRPEHDLTQMVVVEPSIGSGAFVGPLVERLIEAREKHRPELDWMALSSCLRGWDLQPPHVETSQRLAVDMLVAAGCPESDAAQLAAHWLATGDFLLADRSGLAADLVIGNPPYVRMEDIDPELLMQYRKVCPTMGGRADLFVGFFEHSLDLLVNGGQLVFICADRWMRNAYGKRLRRKVIDGFSVDSVLTMHGVDAFEVPVMAYPAITVMSRAHQGEVLNAVATPSFDQFAVNHYWAWVNDPTHPTLTTDTWSAALLTNWHTEDESWPEGSAETLAWLDGLALRYPVLTDPVTKTRIGIGVATGANDSFIVRAPDLPDVEPDRLVPLATNKDVKGDTFVWRSTYLVDPWLPPPARLIKFEDYPRTQAYFESQPDCFKQRAKVTKGGQVWYQTIDRVNHDLLNAPMLVMEDMKAEAHPVLVPAGFYPEHSLYYIVSEGWDLEALGGLLLSKVVERQVAAFCVKMSGGFLRFQAQYLRRVRCPRPEQIAPEVLADLADAFRRRDREAATNAALRAYGMDSLPA